MFVVVTDFGSNCFNKVREHETELESETLDFSTMGNEEEEINNNNNSNSTNNNDNTEEVEDVEEGEISDTASVEEISAEDFNKQDAAEKSSISNKETTKQKEEEQGGNGNNNNGNGRVWTMSDLYRYQMGGGYVSGLYNLAWAQAVQSKPGKSSKPLNELLVEEVDENSKRSSSPSSSVNSNGMVNGHDNDSKEEGELEEGEIDFDMEPTEKVNNGTQNGDVPNSDDDHVMKFDGSEVEVFEKKLSGIREVLESVTVSESSRSFDEVCNKLCYALDGLREVVNEDNVPFKDDLKQLSLTSVGVLSSVFSSMNYKTKECYKDSFSRLLSLVNSCVPLLFTTEHAKEIEAFLPSLPSSGVCLSSISSEKEKETPISSMVNKRDNDVVGRTVIYDLSTMDKFSTDPSINNKANTSLEAPKPGVSIFKSRAVLLPLLDLHKDHDEDSLPSPTREAAPPLPVHRVSTQKLVLDSRNSRMHPYETDALKAVSSYQQKFSRSSFALNDMLPSPTPSEESGNEDGDIGGEVSSSSIVSNFKPANTLNLGQATGSIARSPSDGSGMAGVFISKSAPLSSTPSLTAKASAKSRDPRLRFVSTDSNASDQNHRSLPVDNAPKSEPVGGIINLKRQKSVDDPLADANSLKRHRNLLENSATVRDVKTAAGNGGWLEENDIVGPQTNQLVDNAKSNPWRTDSGGSCTSSSCGISSASISGIEQIPLAGISVPIGGEQVPLTGTNAAFIPDLLKNIAVNPTMLINILKMGQQQRLALEAQQKPIDSAKMTSHSTNSNSVLGTVPVQGAAIPQPSGTVMKTVQVPFQPVNQDELGKIRMKPRDPRRILHNNNLQRNGSMGSEHLKTNVTSSHISQETKDNPKLQKHDCQGGMKPVPSQPLAPPDISMPFTKSLKNIADIVSVSHASTSVPLGHQKVGSMPGVAAGACPQSAWLDVEHLFEGYNDKQKAAIQRERARRIDEQKKLFSARKLCLVLDLDHTLLNSAKFAEVDPAHDEILRKKEEQDREKPRRHIFRFPHMSMWTKLRPGIWNFLEKASKLYELHLYTMGNKLYATEMAKVLDPTGTLFNGRVLSRGDDGDPFDGDERVPKSKDLEGVLGMESDVVIIDDSVRVWPHNKLNLIVVERYIYFPCSRRQFGLPGPSLLEIDHDERPEDGTLACSLAVIERIHQNFFAHPSLDEADVRNILASEQRKILAGCRVVFSRVFPVGEANPHLHPLWQTAEQFGAVCTNQIDEQVTHVVANSLGTDKVNWALSTGRSVVYPGWVEASALLYRRANEQDFAVKT
ncbi:RNA polymerase II C-terminal domain phosphatase-like 3 [Mercurialis annua]|uniref:RNA polymerase II C-terminal domain phosphatase-like 3 n=1 Tax=Mercurialis annua TaxID=3986 RepID=UPI00215EEECF|nr:RNA polymerase II C-terminal domain phosphatase-like 3 [Mercurialis annua]